MNSGNNLFYPKRATNSAGTPIASQSITVSTAAIAGTGYNGDTVVDPVSIVCLDIQTSDVRVRWDGTDPTSSTGHILPASTAYTWTVSQYNSAKFIRDSTMTVDAVIWASPFMLS